RYDEALDTLDRATTEFPDDAGLQVFRAMTLYNAGNGKEAVETLLNILVQTTSDPAISRYRAALLEYSADLDRTWP
ncbi:MAG TPA: tetratricopeptide repeat protein, partial [Acidimicrobiia bacterium]